jgi:hypothetical protein
VETDFRRCRLWARLLTHFGRLDQRSLGQARAHRLDQILKTSELGSMTKGRRKAIHWLMAEASRHWETAGSRRRSPRPDRPQSGHGRLRDSQIRSPLFANSANECIASPITAACPRSKHSRSETFAISVGWTRPTPRLLFSAFSSGLWPLWHDGEKPTLDDRLAVAARLNRSARLVSTPRTRISRC